MASSILGDVDASCVLPRNVAVLLQRAAASPGQQARAGFSEDKSVAWVLAFGQLVLWRYADGVDARIISIYLPSQLLGSHGPGGLHVSVLAQPSAGAAGSNVTAVVCSPTGLLVAWPNVAFSTEPVIHQLQPGPAGSEESLGSVTVTAFTALAPPASSGMLFLGALSLSDGSLHVIQGNQQGMHSRQLAGSVPAAGRTAQPDAPRSMFSVLGQALASAYTEAFDPNAKFLKRTPSGQPARQVLARLPDMHRLHLYLLTDTSLDCWQVSMGMRVSEQLLWSAQTVAAAGNVAPGGSLAGATNCSLALASDGAAFLLLAGGAARHSAWVHRMVIKGEAPPVHVDSHAVPSASQGGSPLAPTAINVSTSGNSVLLAGPGHLLHEWALGDPTHLGVLPSPPATCTLISDDPDTLAVTSIDGVVAGSGGQDGPTWLLLNGTYGVLALHGGSTASAAATPRRRTQSEAGEASTSRGGSESPYGGVGGGPLTTEQYLRVTQVLDAALGQAAAVVAAQQPLLTLSMGLRRQLQGLGVLASPVSAEALATYSASLVDALPKQWSTGGGTMTLEPSVASGGQSLTAGLLTAKAAKYSLLMQCLLQAGMLHALPPAVLRALLEHGEQLSAAAGVLPLHTHLLAAQEPGAPPSLVAQVVQAAGMATEEAGVAGDALQPSELFYCRPTRSLPALWPALAGAARAVREQAESGLGRPGDASAQQLVQHACSLAQLVGVVVAAVNGRQEEARTAYRVAAGQLYRQLGQPSWLADVDAREALDELTQACQAVGCLLVPGLAMHPGMGTTPVTEAALQLSRMLFGCTDVLLSGFAAAVECSPEGEALASLQAQYAAVRQRCLASLLQDAGRELDPTQPLPSDSLLLQVQQLAAAHKCFPVLFEACELVDRWPGQTKGASLHHHMAHVIAEKGVPASQTFARYSFQRLVDEGRPADLLQLPASFYPDLQHFLQQQPQHANLLWPLLLRMSEWVGASDALALDAEAAKASYTKQRRLFSLANLAAHRAGDATTATATCGRLQLLGVQDDLLQLQAHDLNNQPLPGVSGPKALQPSTLLGAALAAEGQGALGKGALLALRVLAALPPDTRQAYRQSEEAAWHALVTATDWAALQQEHSDAGAGDALLDTLRSTPLCQASTLCSQAGVFATGAAGVADTGPAQEVAAWMQAWTADDPAAARYALQALELGMAT